MWLRKPAVLEQLLAFEVDYAPTFSASEGKGWEAKKRRLC